MEFRNMQSHTLQQASVIVDCHLKKKKFQFPILEFLAEHRNLKKGVICKLGV